MNFSTRLVNPTRRIKNRYQKRKLSAIRGNVREEIVAPISPFLQFDGRLRRTMLASLATIRRNTFTAVATAAITLINRTRDEKGVVDVGNNARLQRLDATPRKVVQAELRKLATNETANLNCGSRSLFLGKLEQREPG